MFAVLGPIEVMGPQGTAPLVGRAQRTVAGLLALSAGSVVSSERLVDALWGDEPPRTALRSLHSHVSRVRQALEAAGLSDVLATQDPGYLLRAGAELVDAGRFEVAVRRARELRERGELGEAERTLSSGLSLWRGEVLADGALRGWAAAEAVRLEELRLGAIEDLWEDRLALGRQAEAVPELERLAAEQPARERTIRLLMLALHRCGRRTDALDRYRLLRERLAEELGMDPDAATQELHLSILRGQSTVDAPMAPAQLPPPVGHFWGRQVELAGLDGWLAAAPGSNRIAVICGPAGIGKSALATQWSRGVGAMFPDGQLYVDLRGEDSEASLQPGEVLSAVLRALGVPADRLPASTPDQLGLYRTLSASRRMLLLLDDAGTADHVLPLIPSTAESLLVVTTRRRLAALETQHEVFRVELEALPVQESIGLLRRVLGEQRVAREPEAAQRLVELCAGLPLALRLVAARLGTRPRQSIVDLVADLAGDDRLDLLSPDGDRRGLRHVLGTVYESLSEPAARLFRLIGQHPGQTVSAALAAALTGGTIGRARRDLDDLASAHLLSDVAAGRFRMHDLIRIYAAGLSEPGIPKILFDWYLHLAHTANRLLDPARDRVPAPSIDFPAPFEPDPDSVLSYLDGEQANLVAVAAHAERAGRPEVAWQLAYLVAGYFESRGRSGDRIDVYRRGLSAARRLGDRAAEGLMLSGLGVACTAARRYEEALGHLREALNVLEEIDDRRGLGHVHNNIAAALGELGRLDEATLACERALNVHTERGHRLGMLLAYNNLGHLHARNGRLADSLSRLDQGLALAQADGDLRLEAAVWHNLGETHVIGGDPAAAMRCFARALELRRTTGNVRYQAGTLSQIGALHLRAGRLREADETFTEQLRLATDDHTRAGALTSLAEARLASGDLASADQHLREALTLRARVPDAPELERARRVERELATASCAARTVAAAR